MRAIVVVGLLPLLVCACGGDDTTAATSAAASTATASSTAASSGAGGGATGTGGATASSSSAGGAGGTSGSGGAAPFAITSTAYTEGQMIPKTYECAQGGGQNVSPPLAWTAGPPGTASYAIVMRDLDFNGFVHWAIWDIPAATLTLPEGVQPVFSPATPAGSKQAGGGYLGPCSPNSVNTYEIRVYAVDVATIPGLDQNSSKAQAATAIDAAMVASAALSGES